MAGFNNYNSNSRGGGSKSSKDRDVNTNGFILRNEKTGKFLKVDYFNRCMTFTIGTAPAGQPLDYQTIRNAQSIYQTLVFNQMFTLRDICDDVAEAIKSTGTFTSTGTDAGANDDCCIEISNGSNINEKPGIYLVIYKDIDRNTGRTNSCDYYEFGTGKFYRDYNHRTGQRQVDTSKSAQFKMLTEAVHEACSAFTMAHAHAVQEASKFDKLQTYRALSALATGLGVDLTSESKFEQKTSGTSGNWNRGKNNGNGNGGGYQKKSGGWGSYGGNGYQKRSGGVFENGGNKSFGGGYQQNQPTQSDDAVDVNLDMSALTNVPLNQFS